MSDINIDPTTGLPELPEGYFWRISEHRIEIIRILQEEGEWSEWERIKPKGRRWSTKSVAFEFELRPHPILRLLLPRGYQRARRNLVESCVAWERYGEGWLEMTWEWGAAGPDEPDPVTPENVIERCQAVLAGWEKRKTEEAEREARQSLYGDYPPKKLEEK